MQTGQDVADALETVAAQIRERFDFEAIEVSALPIHAESIRDANGNRVGQWKVADE